MERVDMHRLQELVRLHRMSSGSHAAARMLRMSPNTEPLYRAALMAAGLWDCGSSSDSGRASARRRRAVPVEVSAATTAQQHRELPRADRAARAQGRRATSDP